MRRRGTGGRHMWAVATLPAKGAKPAVARLAVAVEEEDFDLAIVRPICRVVQLERH